MAIINPEIGNREIFDRMIWTPLKIAHPDRHAAISVSPDHRYLQKIKYRDYEERDVEFYNLALWDELLKLYRQETGIQVFSPTPYFSEERVIIMEYMPGMDLDRLLPTDSLSEDDLDGVIEDVGRLVAIKEIEDLKHEDFDLRHLLVNGGLSVIDLEKSRYGNGGVREENEKLMGLIKKFYDGEDIKIPLQKGYGSIPKDSLFGKAVAAVRSKYGKRAEDYLKVRYRGQRQGELFPDLS